MAYRTSLFLLLAALLAVRITATSPPCVPFSLRLTDPRINLQTESSDISFEVTLIGCREHLNGITGEERAALIEEFEEPTEWSIDRLLKASRQKEFRRTMAARASRVLGREAVTDVLIHRIEVWEKEG